MEIYDNFLVIEKVNHSSITLITTNLFCLGIGVGDTPINNTNNNNNNCRCKNSGKNPSNSGFSLKKICAGFPPPPPPPPPPPLPVQTFQRWRGLGQSGQKMCLFPKMNWSRMRHYFSHCSSGPPVHFTHQTLTISSFGYLH